MTAPVLRARSMTGAARWSWKAIEAARREGRLPIISTLGLNEKGQDEYRFGHMSYQEYLTGREYYQRLTTANFDVATVIELFGNPPAHAFAEVKHHLMLQLLAGTLSLGQRAMCLAVMAGGRVEMLAVARKASKRSATSLHCAAAGCPEVHRNADGYCHNHRAEAAATLAKARMSGGDELRVNKELETVGAEALAPYVCAHTTLLSIDVSGARLGATGMDVLAKALKTNTVLTALDVSANRLQS